MLATGCATGHRVESASAFDEGEFGFARARLAGELETDRGDRDYILDRLRLVIATLADGYPTSAEIAANEMYELLSTQGLNPDRTIRTFLTVDHVDVWKGEPFEQAMAYYYIALQKAMIDDWGNARAAAQNSLFLLRDFGENERGERRSTQEIAEVAAREDQQRGVKDETDDDAYLNRGYQPVKTNFALGYMMVAIACHALGRDDEANDNFHEAIAFDPALRSVADAIGSGAANTVVIVDSGRGPKKIAYGMDNAFSRFTPRTPSDQRGLTCAVNESSASTWPVACDVNQMATDHMWNNMEDVRVAKSALGTALLYGGFATAAISSDESTQYIGLGVALAGMLMKATSGADTTYCDLLPQRVYLAAVDVRDADSTIEVSIPGQHSTTLRLHGVDPPARLQTLQVVHARVPNNSRARSWTLVERVLYANDEYEAPVEGDDLPYILGGRCVRAPSEAVLTHYQRAGNLLHMTLAELENLYREEGVVWTVEDDRGFASRNVLEGGRSLVSPQAGTAGYSRLFCKRHPPYEPKSAALREWVKANMVLK